MDSGSGHGSTGLGWAKDLEFAGCAWSCRLTFFHSLLPYSLKCLRGIKFCGLWFWWKFTNITSAKIFSMCGCSGWSYAAVSHVRVLTLLYTTWLLFCMGMRRSFHTTNPSDYNLENCLWLVTKTLATFKSCCLTAETRYVKCSSTDWLVQSIKHLFTATRANLGFQLGMTWRLDHCR